VTKRKLFAHKITPLHAVLQLLSRDRKCLVGVDPGPEEADASVDRGRGDTAARGTPGGGANHDTTALGGATAVTIASSSAAVVEADMSVVDLSRGPAIGAIGISESDRVCYLESVREGAGAAGSAPSRQLASRTSIGRGVGGC
jgi:hypothetical protein